jgi:hypothetical protein
MASDIFDLAVDWVELLLRICEALSSNLGPELGYSNLVLPWIFISSSSRTLGYYLKLSNNRFL